LVLLLFAGAEAVQGQLIYTTNADGLTLTLTGYAGTRSAGPLIIPSTVNGLTVVNIGNGAFNGGSIGGSNGPIGVVIELYPTSVTIPDTVTNIGAAAFFFCAGLTNITIPDSVVSIEENAFWNSDLINVVIPDSVTSIGDMAFYNCDLTNATIGNGVTSIGSNVFAENQDMTSVYFEGNAPSVDPTAFTDDTKATVYYLPSTLGWADFTIDTGLPTALWNPIIQTGDGRFGVQNNRFGFDITGTMNIPIVVEACTNLTNPAWVAQTNVTLDNGSFYFSDAQWTNYPGRFYRISAP
jgi:hypothetical protein